MNLLTTKLALPPLRPGLVSRLRLLTRLNTGLFAEPRRIDQVSACKHGFARRLTLLSAPAGFGKSTLVRTWIEQLRTQSPRVTPAWLALDSSENDGTRFWTYLVATLQTVAPKIGARTQPLLRPADLTPGAWALRVEPLLTVLINDLAAHSGCLLLVLDDYHLITDPGIHRGLTFLLDHLPPQLHMVLATRADPPLPLSKWRGRNEILELRAADLAFTTEETSEFLSTQTGLSLSPQDVAALETKTEGWIAGLRMAALALQTQPASQRDSHSFVSDFSRTPRYLLDYLADEVLAQQPEPLRRFLMQTAVLDQLCDSLCEAITAPDAIDGAGGAPPATLRDLARANLFLEPLEETATWYRYHPLFAQVLRSRLTEQSPDLVPKLHNRAALWYEHAGRVHDAIKHTLKAEAFDRAAQLIEAQAEAALMRSENRTVLDWIEALPNKQISARPTLCVTHAWALLLNGRSPQVVTQRLAEAAATVTRQTAPASTHGSICALHAALAVLRGELSESLSLAQEALSHLSPENTFMRSAALNTLGIAQISINDLPGATETFTQVVDLAQQSGNTMMAVAALCNLAGIRMLHGQLYGARDAYRHALDLSTTTTGQRLPVAVRALLGLGELAREWNDLDAAAQQLAEAALLAEQYGEMGGLICDLTLARVKQAQKETAAAEALLTRAAKRAAASRITQVDDRLVAMARARFAILAMQQTRTGTLNLSDLPPAATAWFREREPVILRQIAGDRENAHTHHDYNMAEAEAIVLTRIYLSHGDAAAALSLIAPLAKTARRQGRERRLIELLVLKVRAHQMAAQEPAALAVLQEAIRLAAPQQYVRTFVNEGTPLLALIQQLCGSTAKAGKLPVDRPPAAAPVVAYAAKLLTQFDAPTPPVQREPIPPQPRLTARELEVLQLIAEGYTNREIGQQLFITLDTVKGHTRKIYNKLDVNSRTRAVAKARDEGILPRD